MGRGSKGGVKCCDRSSSSSSSESSSETSIESTLSDSLDFANCLNCGPGGTPPPYAWLLHFPGMINRTAPAKSCDDCVSNSSFDIIVPFTGMSTNAGHDDCFTFTAGPAGRTSCNYSLSLPCASRRLICNKDGIYLYFTSATFDIVVNNSTKVVEEVYSSFKFFSFESGGNPCLSISLANDFCNPCGTYYYLNTEGKTCHDTFTMSYRLFGQPWLGTQNPCNYAGGDPGDPDSLCEFDESSFATASPMF